jgi:apolipoprotein N-acyltransferase
MNLPVSDSRLSARLCTMASDSVFYFVTLVRDRDKRLVLISAALISAGFAPLPFGFLSYAALMPLIVALSGKGLRRGFQLGYLFGFEFSLFALYWVANVTFFGAIAMVFLHSFFYAAIAGAFAWLCSRNRRFLLSFPFVWTAVEYLRTQSQFAFPWSNLSYTQSYYLPLIQTVDIWGDIGLSFWIVTINILLYLAWKSRRRPVAASVPVLIVAGFLAGALIYDRGQGEYEADISVALLQGHFPPDIKWDWEIRDYTMRAYDSLTREADARGVDLIIWPETAAPMYLVDEPDYYHRIRRLAEDLEAYVLVGTLVLDVTPDGQRSYYNGCYQFTPWGQLQPPYKKTRLVPFSEKVPYSDYFPPIKQIDLGQSDFAFGDSLMLFQHPKGMYGCLICFELAFSDLARQFVNRGAEFLVTITNDTWFGRTSGPYQHMQMAPFRAIENRIWIARCANSGFSFTVDPYGTKHGTSDLEKRTVVFQRLGRIGAETFFTKHGLWLPKLCVLATFLFLLAGIAVKLH